MAAASIQRTLAALAVDCVSVRTDIDCDRRKSLQIPGTDYYISLDAAQPRNTADSQLLLAAIANWLSKEFGLPVVDRFPEIKLISPGEIGALRYNARCLRRPTRSRETPDWHGPNRRRTSQRTIPLRSTSMARK